MSKPTLREQQTNVWSQYPGYPKSDWRDEVMHNDTTLGYWEWVEHQIEQKENEES
jgi:hypothetical protein